MTATRNLPVWSQAPELADFPLTLELSTSIERIQDRRDADLKAVLLLITQASRPVLGSQHYR